MLMHATTTWFALSLLAIAEVRATHRTRNPVPPDIAIVHEGNALRPRAVPGIPGNDTSFIQYLSNGQADVYIIHLELGQPPVRYPFQLDLASSDLVIASTLCTSSSCPDVKSSSTTPLYHPGRSTSFEAINGNSTRFNLTYADGSRASGFLALEQVGIVGAGARVTVENQVVAVVNETTMDLQALGVVGVVGLGFPRLSILAREGLGDAVVASATATSATATSVTATSAPTSQASSTPIDSTSLFFSILPIETITPLTPAPTSITRRAVAPAYFPPLVENLFSHPSISTSSPRLAYPVFSLALANTSAPFSAGNANASLTWGGVSSAFVGNGTGRKTVADIDWVEVVPFARAISEPLSPSAGNSTGDVKDLVTLQGEEYLYWTVPLSNVSLNGTDLALQPTYNASLTGIQSGSIALLDAGTNGIYGPQQDVVRFFSGIKDARQVAEGQWAVPCDSEVTLAFTIGRTTIELQPSEWMYARVVGGSMCLAWPRVARPSADGVDWQLGTPVLRKIVAVFSYGISGVQAPLVGLLPLPPSTVDVTSTTVSSTAPRPVPTSVQDASEILEHVTKTIGTALPNVLLPDPSYTTPAYAFTTPAPALGAVQSVGLGNPLVYEVSEVPVVQQSLSLPTTGATTQGAEGGVSGTSQGGRASDAVGTGNTATSGAWGGPRRGAGVGVAMLALGIGWLCL